MAETMGFVGVGLGLGSRRARRPGRSRCVARIEDKGTAVIVGAGPTGLGSAMMLAQMGWTDVLVVEKREGLQQTQCFREYTYLLKERTLKFGDQLGFSDRMVKEGVATSAVEIEAIDGKGQHKRMKDNSSKERTVWMRRARFLRLMKDYVMEKYGDVVNVQFGAEFDYEEDENGRVKYILRNIDGSVLREIAPSLVLGCDGLHSVVRQLMEKRNPDKFCLKKYSTPTEDLRYKAIPILENVGSARNEDMVIMRNNEGERFRLGMFPCHEEDGFRIGSIVLDKRHEFWSITDREECFQYVQNRFPSVNVREIISKEDMDIFLHQKKSPLPPIETVSGLQSTVGDVKFALLGDAAHSMPPDLGEGVNSAMEDVSVLRSALEANPDDLRKALSVYEEKRLKEIEALLVMTQYAAPFQYRQNRWRANLWMLEIASRMLLNKAFPLLFHKHVLVLVDEYSYSEALKMDLETKRRLSLSGMSMAAGFVVFNMIVNMHILV